MKVLGVDPGGSGALALINGDKLVEVEDMPVFAVTRANGGARQELDVHALTDMLTAWLPDTCWMEQTNAHPGDGAAAAYQFGRIAGACEAILRSCNAPFHFVQPQVWKRAMGLLHKDKDDSRAKATAMFPNMAEKFRLKKHDGRAEAALIALYGVKQGNVWG